MSYLTQDQIANNHAMQARVAQAATTEDLPDGLTADQWTAEHRRTWAAAPGWDAAWESSLAGHPDDEFWDPGQDEAVITDGMILSQVQAMVPAKKE
jgi:hypothetical protein